VSCRPSLSLLASSIPPLLTTTHKRDVDNKPVSTLKLVLCLAVLSSAEQEISHPVWFLSVFLLGVTQVRLPYLTIARASRFDHTDEFIINYRYL
jgi:hypothetical protein